MNVVMPKLRKLVEQQSKELEDKAKLLPTWQKVDP